MIKEIRKLSMHLCSTSLYKLTTTDNRTREDKRLLSHMFQTEDMKPLFRNLQGDNRFEKKNHKREPSCMDSLHQCY